MQITNKRFKIPKIETELTYEYIQSFFKDFDVIRWAIVDISDDFYLIDSAILKK